jgi:serine/threonine protein phosphatase PrpC
LVAAVNATALARLQDVSVVRHSGFASRLTLYAVADGHNGRAAARHVAAVLPGELERQLLGGDRDAASVQRALARTFVAIDDAVCTELFQSGVWCDVC